MDIHNIINTTEKEGERVTSSYAEIYFDDEFCEYKENPALVIEESNLTNIPIKHDDGEGSDLWVSPSDLLIDIVELKPPFTSKITRGRTHEGILAIGDEVLETERTRFLKRLNELLHENDDAWNNIMEHEKAVVTKTIKKIYDDIFEEKSKIMQKELLIFYENTLQELEDHIKTEISAVLIDVHANIVADLNTEIFKRIANEKEILIKTLKKRYLSELEKIRTYYDLLYNNEIRRNTELVNKSIVERNDAIKAYFREINTENITSVMYVMSHERKKCRIEQFIMKTYQDLELKEKLEKLKEKKELVDAYKQREINITDLNKEWEEKIQKILQIFLRFISFSMKLLPEQATFLLDLEKMVVLQINEIQKKPEVVAPPILISETNIFKFENCASTSDVCDKEPFVVSGDSADTIPTRYGSRETLPDEKELPSVRLGRRYIYAKCEKFNEVKEFLEAQRCKCREQPIRPPPEKSSSSSVSSRTSKASRADTQLRQESSNELFVIEDFQRIKDCPVRNCTDWMKRMSFPYLNSYLDFTEDNFKRVKAVLENPEKPRPAPELYDEYRTIHRLKAQFAATEEKNQTVGTQYSSQEDITAPDIECTCTDDQIPDDKKDHEDNLSINQTINEVLLKRRLSLRRLVHDNPNLLKMFTDESFDFVL